MQRTMKLTVFLVSLAIGAMTNFLPSAAIAEDQGTQAGGSIDIASIVNFKEPGTLVTSQSETSDAPSVVISGRSQYPSNEWERYRMESTAQGKGGFLSGGVIAALRIPLK